MIGKTEMDQVLFLPSEDLLSALESTGNIAKLQKAIAYEGSAGLDLYASEAGVIPAYQTALISTGIKLVIPPGYVGIIKERSSVGKQPQLLWIKTQLRAGVIDSDYRGNVMVKVTNTSGVNISYYAGERLPYQLVIYKNNSAFTMCNEKEYLDADAALSNGQDPSTLRGSKGFGSSN